MSEPTAEQARHDALTDKVVALVQADPCPGEAVRNVMAGLAGLVVAELGPREGVSWLYQFADEIVEIEAGGQDAWAAKKGKAP